MRWTTTGLTLYMDRSLTGVGQRLDMPWTKVGFCVQDLSGRTSDYSTGNSHMANQILPGKNISAVHQDNE